MTKQHIEFVLSGYGVPFTDALADKLLEMYDEEAASYQHTINELNKALSENKGDLISRNQAQAKLKEICERFNYFYDDRYGEGTSGYAFVHAFDDVPPVENKGEWIPVTERVPEKNVWVLVTVEQSGKCYQEIMQIDRYKETWTDNIDYYAEAVKAWMPLPKPYKENDT